MPRRPFNDQPDVRDCHERAAECRQRAREIADPQGRAFWQAQEQRWLAIAAGRDSVASIADAPEPGVPDGEAQPEDGIEALIGVFHRVCADVMADEQQQHLPHRVAHIILEAALSGEDDLDSLYARAIKAVSN